MDLLKHSLLILRDEEIGVGNNNTRLNRKFLVYTFLNVADVTSDNIRKITSSNQAILLQTGLRAITTITSLLPIKLLQQGL